MEILPKKIICLIGDFMPISRLSRFSRTCKRFNKFLKHKLFEEKLKYSLELGKSPCHLAVKYGDRRFIKQCIKSKNLENLSKYIAKYDDIKTLKYCLKRKIELPDILKFSAKWGNSKVFRTYLTYGLQLSGISEAAILASNPDLLQLLYSLKILRINSKLIELAANSGKLESLDWLNDQVEIDFKRLKLTRDAKKFLAYHNFINMLEEYSSIEGWKPESDTDIERPRCSSVERSREVSPSGDIDTDFEDY